MVICDFCEKDMYHVKSMTKTEKGVAICVDCVLVCLKSMLPDQFGKIVSEDVKDGGNHA